MIGSSNNVVRLSWHRRVCVPALKRGECDFASTVAPSSAGGVVVVVLAQIPPRLFPLWNCTEFPCVRSQVYIMSEAFAASLNPFLFDCMINMVIYCIVSSFTDFQLQI